MIQGTSITVVQIDDVGGMWSLPV